MTNGLPSNMNFPGTTGLSMSGNSNTNNLTDNIVLPSCQSFFNSNSSQNNTNPLFQNNNSPNMNF